VFFGIARVLNPLLETASNADQKRCGSYHFLSSTIKYLECHERVVLSPRGLRYEPRPCWEREEEERMEARRHA
jgi:hypothetical protein